MALRVPPRWEATCLPHWNGVFPAHAQAERVVGRIRVGAPGVEPAVLLDQRELLLGVRAIPFCIVSSLKEPVIVPSRLAPLSPKM